MSEIVISVKELSKTFKLPHEKQGSIKSAIINFYRSKRTFEIQEVLKDISLDINKGDFYGIVGRNGSGKSTLLKILAGIYTPTKGRIDVNGKLTPFIELGVGFNPELTGRENVFLNGALLGFNRKEVSRMYKEIVAFAELEKFMDQKLKNYSSGMQVRLAFSIAIRADTDILILDEVLAVGDEAFQQKCIDIFEKYKADGRTVVLVTHDMEIVRKFCNRAILINNGKIVKSGDPQEIATEYSKLNMEKTEQAIRSSNDRKPGTNIDLKINSEDNKSKTDFDIFEEMKIKISWPEQLSSVKNLGLAIHKNSGEYMFGDNTLDKDIDVSKRVVTYKVKLALGPGKYHLVAGLFGETARDTIDFEHHGPEFIIKMNPNDKFQGLVRLKGDWE